MAVPKSKVSKQRRDKRRANWKLAAPAVTTCPKCGAYRLPHRLCKACMTSDIDKMEKYGIYEVLPEDLATCEYVCPSKIEWQSYISAGIDLMLKEMA